MANIYGVFPVLIWGSRELITALIFFKFFCVLDCVLENLKRPLPNGRDLTTDLTF